MNNEIKKGLIGVISDETKISEVMPDINSLTYRGYTVQELCEKCNFEEVAYLILNDDLPNKKQLSPRRFAFMRVEIQDLIESKKNGNY